VTRKTSTGHGVNGQRSETVVSSDVVRMYLSVLSNGALVFSFGAILYFRSLSVLDYFICIFFEFHRSTVDSNLQARAVAEKLRDICTYICQRLRFLGWEIL